MPKPFKLILAGLSLSLLTRIQAGFSSSARAETVQSDANHPLSPESLQTWAHSLAELPDIELNLNLLILSEQTTHLFILLIEDRLLSLCFNSRPLLHIPERVSSELPKHIPDKLLKLYALIQTPSPDLLDKLLAAEPDRFLWMFISSLKQFQDFTPDHELARLTPDIPKLLTAELDILSGSDAEPENPAERPDPLFDFVLLTLMPDPEHVKAVLHSTESASPLFRQSDLWILARLQLARLENNASSLAEVKAFTTDPKLSPALQIEALITHARLQHPHNPTAALSTWQTAEKQLASLPNSYRLQLMLAHEYAAAGLREQARPLYQRLAQDPDNPYPLRVSEEIKRLGV